jgi:hypothetical protein
VSNDPLGQPQPQNEAHQGLLWRPLRDLAWQTQLEQLSTRANDYRLNLLAVASVNAVTGPGIDAIKIAQACRSWETLPSAGTTVTTGLDLVKEHAGPTEIVRETGSFASGSPGVWEFIVRLFSGPKFSDAPILPPGPAAFVDLTAALSWGPKILSALLPVLSKERMQQAQSYALGLMGATTVPTSDANAVAQILQDAEDNPDVLGANANRSKQDLLQAWQQTIALAQKIKTMDAGDPPEWGARAPNDQGSNIGDSPARSGSGWLGSWFYPSGRSWLNEQRVFQQQHMLLRQQQISFQQQQVSLRKQNDAHRALSQQFQQQQMDDSRRRQMDQQARDRQQRERDLQLQIQQNFLRQQQLQQQWNDSLRRQQEQQSRVHGHHPLNFMGHPHRPHAGGFSHGVPAHAGPQAHHGGSKSGHPGGAVPGGIGHTGVHGGHFGNTIHPHHETAAHHNSIHLNVHHPHGGGHGLLHGLHSALGHAMGRHPSQSHRTMGHSNALPPPPFSSSSQNPTSQWQIGPAFQWLKPAPTQPTPPHHPPHIQHTPHVLKPHIHPPPPHHPPPKIPPLR